MTTDTEQAEQQARAQLSSIRELVQRLAHTHNCEGDRDGCDMPDPDIISALGYSQKEARPTDEQNADYHDRDKAQQAIEEDALSVEVRSEWHQPGTIGDEVYAEFRILLCTGGPAVQILGDVGEHGQPDQARLMCQDWFTPWTEVILESEETADLLTFAQTFYFGD